MSDDGRGESSGGGEDERLLGPPAPSSAAPLQRQKVKRMRKAKHLLALPFRKIAGKGNARGPPPPYNGDVVKAGYLCFMPPRSPPDSSLRPTTSGVKKTPYYEFVKSMLESNDFYSPDCDVHRRP